MLLERVSQPFTSDRKDRQQVLWLVLRIFVEVEKQRAFLIGSAPDAVALEELLRGQVFVAAPELVVLAAATEELAQARERRRGPRQMPADKRQQPVQVAPYIELAALLGRQREHEVRAHQVEHGRV